MKKLLIFGSEGRLGRDICADLKSRFEVYGVDVADCSSQDINYVKLEQIDELKKIYRENNFYAVIHSQQVKSKSFLEARLDNLDLDEFRKVIHVNLELTFLSTQLYINSLSSHIDGVRGRIINLSSTYSTISSSPTLYEGTEMGNPVHYSISKGGVDSLTKYVAAHFKQYMVLCNSISPHGIENNQGNVFKSNFAKRSPLGRLSETSEVLPAVRFLLDDANTYTNGANIAVDGGWTAC